MMKKFTSSSLKGKNHFAPIFVLFFIVLTLLSVKSYSQTKNYATTVSSVSANGMSSLLGCGFAGLQPCYNTLTVENPNNAITSSDATFATVKSYGGVALGLSGYSGEIELKFPAPLAAGTTSFIRINSSTALLDQLLSGNLGSLLSSVVGGVALGDHSFEVGARNSSGTTVLSGSSANSFPNANLKLIKDGNGYFYMAITPAQAYDRVYVKDVTQALLLSTGNSTDVYYAFTTTGSDPCAQAYATSFEGSGLTTSVLGLGKAGVTNPENAINANPNDFSELSLGLLGVAGSISQDFYFYQPANAGDDFNLRFATSTALLTAGVLNNLTVTAYNGNTQVYTTSANTLLNLDLLALLTSGQAATVPFSPDVAFDRVKVTLSSLLDANLAQTIQIYGLTKSAGRPTFTAPSSNAIAACYNTSAALTATTPNTNELIWYDAIEGGTALATVPYNGTYNTPLLTANKTYYVAARRLTCLTESVRVPVTITVNPAIVFNTTTLTNATNGFAYSKQIDVATGGTPGFTYALATPGTLPAGVSLSASGLISGTPTATGTFPFAVVATDSKGCPATANYSLTVTAALALTPGALPDGTTGTLYPPQTLPAATGGTGPYTYSAPILPPGLTFDPITREITGTPTQPGSYTIPVTVTDANGNTITSNFTVKITDPLVLPPAVLANGTTGTPYPAQVIPSATGGSGTYTYSAPTLPPGLVFDPLTREITGTPSAPGVYTVPVTVTDGDGKTVTTNYTITVTDPLVLPPAALANGNVGTAYPAQTIPSATGGVGPYTYVASNLPPGLTFDPATREITGTPTQAGTYSVLVTVTDSQGNTASNSYPIQVIGVLNLPTATLPNGVVGDVYPTQTLPAVTGGASPYTYVASNLPPGLSFNTTTREITGTPTLGGTFTVGLTATDAGGNVINTDYTIVVTVNPPVVAAAAVCAGSPATLSVSNLQAGVTYNWYAATGSTPLATNNSGVFVSPPISSATTFYVESVSGTAVSSRTAVNVTINPAANPAVVTTNNQVVNAGQSTVLTATADAGNTINWYAAASGGAALATGNSFTTPVLNTNTTYYVETTTALGCPSSSRVPVTVTVVTGGGNPNCNAANTQNSGINAFLCLLCGITNPGNSTDADPNNFTRITLGVGVGSTGYQQLIFPGAGSATDSIRLDLGLPTGLADVSVLGNITVNIISGGTVVSTSQLNSSLINLALLNGSRFTATVFAGVPFDRVELRFGSLISAISSLDIYGATIIYPNPTLTAGNQTICSGSTASLSATANGGTTLTWYDAATGGSVLANGGTYTTPALTATTTYYIAVSKAGCANATRVPVVVTVTPVIVVPVLAPIANNCAGNTATLTLNNPQAGVTYNWYDVATGGTPVFTGNTFTTPVLNTTTTYYVEGAIGTCLSSSRAAATITVNPRPSTPMVVASSTTVNPGQTAILTASSVDTDVNFNWYDSATATIPIYTGTTFVTPPLTATTSYYVESVSTTTGCTSTNRVQVTVTVNTGGVPVPAPCETATTQTNGVTGVLALLAGVSNPNLAIDADAQTASSLVIPVGLLASVYQRVGFGTLSTVGDTVKVLISSPGKLLSLSLLGSAELTTYNGLNSNNDAMAINSGLLNVELLSGDTQALITFVPANAFDGVELRLNSGVLGALGSLNLNYVQRSLKSPVVTISTTPVCIGQTALLTVNNPVAGLTYRWFDQTGTYIAGSDGVTFTTPLLTGDTKFYVASVSATGCESYKTLINVVTEPAPTAPQLVSAAVTACTGTDVVLQVLNPVPGFTYKWYDAANVYQVGKDGTSFTALNITAGTTFSVEAVNACGTVSATKTSATITLGTTIDPPVVVPASATIPTGSTASFTATSSANGATFRWYNAANTIVSTAALFTTPALFANTTYTVEAVGPTGCISSSRTIVNVIVVPLTPGTTPCGTATIDGPTLVTGTVTIGAGVTNTTFAVDNDINSGSTLSLGLASINASVSHRIGFTGGLSNVGDTLTVKISSPGNLLSLAVLPSITLTTYQGATSNGDVMTLSNPLIQLNLLSDGSSATITYVPTSKFDGVELKLNSGLLAALTSVNFDYAKRSILAPDVNATAVSACLGSSAVLSVQNPQPGITYSWYEGTNLVPSGTGVTFSTPTTLTVGNHDFFVTATGTNGCETVKVKVVVTITAPPVAPVPAPGNPTTTCAGTPATLSVVAVAGIVYNWYDAATAGNLLVSNNSSLVTSAALTAGTYTYYVEAVNGNSCSSAARTPISITVNANATAADIAVSGNTSLCASATTVLTASSTTITNPVFTWYSDAALTNQIHLGATFTTPAILAATNYYVTVSGDNTCANPAGSAKSITINVNPVAVASDINLSGTSTTCAGSPIVLTASSTTVTNPIFTWYADAALTTPVFTGPVYNIAGLTTSTTYYVTVKGDNKCENAPGTAKSISITINPSATLADLALSGTTTICQNTTTVLSAVSTTVSNPVFTWYSDAALTVVANVGATFTTPALAATTTYYVTVKGDNKCENTPANARVITVTVKAYAIAADITVANANACAGSSVSLMASSLTVTQPVFTWYSDASLTVPVFTGPTYNLPSVTANTTLYVTVKGTNKCENAAADAKVVTINVNPLATSTDLIVNGGTTVCSGTSAVLTASSPTVTNPVFTWYSNAALTNVAFVGTVFTTPFLNASTTYYVTVKGDNRCENAPGNARSVSITINPSSTASDLTVAGSTTICQNSSAVLTASSTTVTNPVFTWYSDAALTIVANNGATFTTPALAATTTYYVTVKGDNKCENTAANAKVVVVTVKGNATVADINLANASVCAGSPVSLTASSTTVVNPVFTWYSDPSLTVPVFTGPTYSLTSVTATTTFYVTIKGDNTCENTAANAKVVTITVNPRATSTDVLVSGGTTICAGSSAVLTASSTTVTNPVFTWYSDAALTTVSYVGSVFTTPVLTATSTYYVTVKGDNKCENTAGTGRVVQVTVNAVPVSPILATTGTNICSGESTVLTVQNVQTGVNFQWYDAATNGNLLFTGTAFTTPVLTANTSYYVQAVGTGGCSNPSGRTMVVVTVNLKPSAPVLSANSINVCAGSTGVLSIANPQTGVTYNWYTAATGGTLAGSGSTFTTPAITANTTYYAEAVNGTCTSTSRTSASVLVSAAPAAPAQATATNNGLCSGSTALLTVSNPDATLTYKWYAASTGGAALGQGVSFTTPALTATTIFYVESVNAGGCSSTTRTAVTVNILPILATPVVTVQSTTAASVTFSWNAVNGATGYEISTNNGASWQSPTNGALSTTQIVLGLKPDQAVTIIVRALGQTACQTSANSTPVTGKAANPLGNEVFIPNVFSPNNDGKNDIFLVYGNKIAGVKMNIYTQWGQLIFQTESATTGWDGTYKGVHQPTGVYVYMIDITATDGTSTMRRGTVTLIR